MFKIKQWVPGMFPVPIFQTWCCTSSAVTSNVGDFDDLRNAGLMPQMLECVCDNLRMNRVGIDCVHYLFNDDACREFLAMTFPTDVVYAYDRLIPTAFKADLWRYCILYMFGGVYMDIKYKWNSDTVTIRDVIEGVPMGVPPPYDGSERAQATSERAQATSERAQASEGGCVGGGGGTERAQATSERAQASEGGWGVGGGGVGGGGVGGGVGGVGGGDLLVLERDAPGLWPEGHFGIHNAFIITKPKNRLFFNCIQHIVSYSKNKVMWPLSSTERVQANEGRSAGGGGAGGGGGGGGWMTLPLFITGPGLLGDVWRKNFGTGLVAGNYASMAQFFRLFYEGNGVIGYLHSDDNYIKLLRVYDEYSSELERYGGSSGGGGGGRLAHYTILWSRGILWRD